MMNSLLFQQCRELQAGIRLLLWLYGIRAPNTATTGDRVVW